MAQRQPGHYLVNRYTRKVIAGPDSPVVLNATLRRKAAKLSRGVKCPLAVVKWDGGKAVAASNVVVSVAQTVDEDVRAMKAPTPDTTSMSHSVSASTSKWYVVSNDDSAKFADMCAEDGAGTSLWKKGSTNSVVRVLAEPDQLGSVQRAIRQFKAREFTGSQSLSLKHSVSASIPRPSMGDRLLLKNGKKVVVVLNTAWPMKLQVVDISQPLSGARRPFDVSPDEVSKIVDTGAIRTPLDDGSSGEAESTPRMRGKMLKPGAKDKRFKASNVSAAASFRVINGQHEDIVKGAIANMGLDHLIRPGATARDMYDSAWGALAESVGENKAEKMLQEEIRDAAKRRGVKLSHVISADSSLRYVFPSAKHAAKFVEQIQALSPDLKTGSQGTAGVVLNPGLYAADIADTARKLGGKPPAALSISAAKPFDPSDPNNRLRLQGIHRDYLSLKAKSSKDLLETYKSAAGKVNSVSSIQDSGGKQAVIDGILRDRYGQPALEAYYKMKVSDRKALSLALNSTNTQIRNLFLRKGAGAFWSVRYEDMSKDDIIKDLEQQNKPYLDRVIQALKTYEMSVRASGKGVIQRTAKGYTYQVKGEPRSITIKSPEEMSSILKALGVSMSPAQLEALPQGRDWPFSNVSASDKNPAHSFLVANGFTQSQHTHKDGDKYALYSDDGDEQKYVKPGKGGLGTLLMVMKDLSEWDIFYGNNKRKRGSGLDSLKKAITSLKLSNVAASDKWSAKQANNLSSIANNLTKTASRTGSGIDHSEAAAGHELAAKANRYVASQTGADKTSRDRLMSIAAKHDSMRAYHEKKSSGEVAASSPVEIVMKQSDLAVMKRKYPALKIISTRTRGNDLYPLEIAVKVQGDDADDAEEEFSSQLAEERSVGKRSLSNVSAAIPAQYERAIKQLLGKHVPNGEIEATINDVKSGIDKPLAAAQALLRDTPLSGDRDVLTKVADALERLSGNNALSAVSATNPLLLDAVSRKAR